MPPLWPLGTLEKRNKVHQSSRALSEGPGNYNTYYFIIKTVNYPVVKVITLSPGDPEGPSCPAEPYQVNKHNKPNK